MDFCLKPDQIHVFFTQADDIKDEYLLSQYQRVISQTEQAKMDRYVFEKDKHVCLVTRALLRFVLSLVTRELPAGFEFIENPYGKPSIKPGFIDIPLKFNLSHSENVSVCAIVLNHEIGVDIEYIRRKIDLNIPERFFTQYESAYIKSLAEEDRQKAFFRLWTLKESYIKAKGMGLSISLDAFGFDIDGQNTLCRFHESLNDRSEHWDFFRFSLLNDYKAAIAVQSCRKSAFELKIYNCIPFQEIQEQKNIQGIHSTK